jgi:RHS repeat-associated protein
VWWITINRGAQTTNYSYDDVGNLASFSTPNGVTHNYTYNTLNRLTNVGVSKTAATLASYAYTLGAAGNRTAVTENTGRTVNYAYDNLYRLTSETIANAVNPNPNGTISYIYDAVGNRLSRTSTVVGVPTVASQTVDANDRLTTDGYDNNGNTIVSSGNGYVYDFENRLLAVNVGSPNEIRIVYDGDGNRVSKTVGGVTTKFLVDTNNLTGYAQVVEEVQGGNVVRQYSHGHDLLSQRQLIAGNWTTSFYQYDGHGSVRGLTDTNGTLTDTFTYDAFGLLIHRTGTTPNLYLYAGEQFDPDLGLYYNRARYLNTGTGRFWTMDSYEGNDYDPHTLHKYLYAIANPANRVDPSGLASVAEETFKSQLVSQLSTLANIASTALRVYWTVTSVADTIESVFGVARALQTGDMVKALQESLEGFEQWRYQFSYSQVLRSFSENWPRILATGLPQWSQGLFRSMVQKGIRVSNFLIYMPTPLPTPMVEIKTGLNIRGIGVKLIFGGPGTQVMGGGVETSNGQNHQLFRMDIGSLDLGHGNPGGLGSIAKKKASEIDIWEDPPFHYHVLRY